MGCMQNDDEFGCDVAGGMVLFAQPLLFLGASEDDCAIAFNACEYDNPSFAVSTWFTLWVSLHERRLRILLLSKQWLQQAGYVLA